MLESEDKVKEAVRSWLKAQEPKLFFFWWDKDVGATIVGQSLVELYASQNIQFNVTFWAAIVFRSKKNPTTLVIAYTYTPIALKPLFWFFWKGITWLLFQLVIEIK